MSSTRTTTETTRLAVICTRSESPSLRVLPAPFVSVAVPRRPELSALSWVHQSGSCLGGFCWANIVISNRWSGSCSVLIVVQIPIELRAPSSAGGNNQIFSATVGYDSGCSRMSLRAADLAMLVTPTPLAAFPVVISNTAGGQVRVPRASIEVRVLSRDKAGVLLPWTSVHCGGNQNLRKPIFREPLEDNLFICNQPHLQRLYVAHTKTQLAGRMPR